MSRKYFVWKDPACGGMNIEWVEISGKEFYALISSAENQNRWFVRLGNEICPEADIIVLEVTKTEYLAWETETDAQRYRRRFEKQRAAISLDGPQNDGNVESLYEAVADESVDVERTVLHHLAHKQLETALKSIDDADARLLTEIYIKGRTYADVAREQGVNRSTVLRRVSSVIAKLQKFF